MARTKTGRPGLHDARGNRLTKEQRDAHENAIKARGDWEVLAIYKRRRTTDGECTDLHKPLHSVLSSIEYMPCLLASMA